MMATEVILPALGMAQDTGKIVQWLKAVGEWVALGEPLVAIETDKATVEVEAPAAGVLAEILVSDGGEAPVGQTIARILAAGEVLQQSPSSIPAPQHGQGGGEAPVREATRAEQPGVRPASNGVPSPRETAPPAVVASALAARIAAEHNIDLKQVRATGHRVQKADVLAYLQHQETPVALPADGRIKASPKARRLASEQGKDLSAIRGSGPEGAVLAADVEAAVVQDGLNAAPVLPMERESSTTSAASGTGEVPQVLGTIWRIMAERTTQSWTSVPHFYLVREVNVERLIAWRARLVQRGTEKITYTDLLVKIVAAALRLHPRLNACWKDGTVVLQQEIHVGLAVAIDEGLVVPVIQKADTLGVREIARRRGELVEKAQKRKLRTQDISKGTFALSNLGMYNIDAFNAIIDQPQAAILAVGRMAERVVAVQGQPAVRTMMILTLSCDHRIVDGARGARFLDTIAGFIEEPLGLLDE